MKKTLLYSITILVLFGSCSNKKVKQGSIAYTIEYQLPDSLNKYLAYLPKSAMVYFKGDSAVSIQQMNDESTTIIIDKTTHFMRALLRSNTKKYVIDYDTIEQAKEANARLGYTYQAGAETKTIAGYKALKYTLTNKETLEQSEVWFTKDISVVPNSLTMAFDTIHGFPVAFITNQGGMLIKHTVKQIKFEPAPAGVFSTPAGYEPLTPKQLREMPVEN
ncbi:MAG TPA: DUF4412 domain-containing protein [Mucilaginibacter sp.]|nr:DUF4412 domain-containing protein [Mucilaginibacter sp.]